MKKILKTQCESDSIVAECIKSNEVVIIPTDTIYGFSAKVPDGDCKIRKIKGRAETKPFIELIAKPDDYKKYSDDNIPESLLSLWPGPLTIIVNRKETLGGGTVALRCPGDLWLRNVIEKSGTSIYSTSVNRSGEPSLFNVSDMENEFKDEVSLIVDDGEKKGGVPSTLVDISKGSVKILRQGAVKLDI